LADAKGKARKAAGGGLGGRLAGDRFDPPLAPEQFLDRQSHFETGQRRAGANVDSRSIQQVRSLIAIQPKFLGIGEDAAVAVAAIQFSEIRSTAAIFRPPISGKS
jgi:hypothetical protein